MAEILAVTWEESEITLRRVPSEGVWKKDAKALKRVSLPRPTRAGRLANPEIGGALGIALTDLFADVDINVPCWLLLPNGWTLRFVADPPEFKSQDLTLDHLRWEARQRIQSDPEDYKISAALLMGGGRYFVCIFRSEVIQKCLVAAESADLELAGIGLEPNPEETYTFEHPLDLRDALPLETEESPTPAALRKKVSPAVVGIFFGLILIVGGYLIFSSGSKTPKKPVAQRAAKTTMTAREAVKPPTETPALPTPDTTTRIASATSEPPTQTPVETRPVEAEMPSSKPSATLPVGEGSIVRGIFSALPAGAKIELVILSPVDLKVEASGIGSPDQWLAAMKRLPGWSAASIIGNYSTVVGKVTALRLQNPGWRLTDGSSGWLEAAKSAGLTAKGTSASGSLESALALIDQLWKNSRGISKIYLSPSGASWQVVIQ